MKKIMILILMAMVMVGNCYSVSNYDLGAINSRITSDYFSDGGIKDRGTNAVRELQVLIAFSSNPGTGKIWYSDSGVSNEGDGSSWLNAKDTLQEAIVLSDADGGDNRGDVFLVAQGHAESGTDPDLVDVTVSGGTVVFLGNGSNAATFTFADTDTTFAIGAPNVTMYGGRMLAGISEVVAGVIIEAAADNFVWYGTKGLYANFPEPTTSTFEFDVSIQNTTGADDVSLINLEAYSADATGATKFYDGGAGVVNRFSMIGCLIHGEYSVAAVFSDQVDLENYYAGNTITNMTSGQHAVELTAAATGTFEHNNLFTDAWATMLDPGSVKCLDNWGTIAVDEQAIQVPISATTATVTADDDGSILERSEHLIQQFSATKVLTTIMSGQNGLFTVAGGPIVLNHIVGYVTTVIEGKSVLINYTANPTDPGSDTVFGTDGTALEINADATGTLYSWDGVIATDLSVTTNGVILAQGTDVADGLIIPIGAIELAAVVSTSATGEITFYISYTPLAPGATVVAQ